MTHRKAKKTETIEVRVPEELKTGFIESCQRRGQSASAALRDFMTARIASSDNHPLISKGLAIMARPTFSIPALLSLPLIATAFLAMSSAVEADDVELMFEISIRDAASQQSANGVINLDYGQEATFRLTPSRDESGEYYYDLALSAQPCATEEAVHCASENVMLSVDVIRHDATGETLIASPQLLARYGARSGLRVEPLDGYSISIEMFADYASQEES